MTTEQPETSRGTVASHPVARFWLVLYEIGLLTAILLIALALLEGAYTCRLPVVRTLDRDRFVVADPSMNLPPGTEVPIYRFSPDWKSEIGWARVETCGDGRAVLRCEPSRMRWPLGRTSVITGTERGTVSLQIGSAQGIVPGNNLAVFDENRFCGFVTVVSANWNSADVTFPQDLHPKAGMIATEFIVPTQVLSTPGMPVHAIQILLIMLAAAAYATSWMVSKRSPFELLGSFLRGRRRGAKPFPVGILFDVVLWIPASWSLVRFAIGSVYYLLKAGASAFADWVGRGSTGALGRAEDIGAVLTKAEPYVISFVIIVYGYLLFRGRSPLRSFREALAFRGTFVDGMSRGWLRNTTLWLLHLAIAYFFGYSLFSFLGGNLNAALDLGWQGAGPRVSGSFNLLDLASTREFLSSIAGAAVFACTHLPRPADAEAAFATARYLLWSVTVLGCLVGYLHSVLSYLWGKRIRNLDFTIVGWLTNAVCYGPLLGVVLWQMLPPLTGTGPLFGPGPLRTFDLAAELLLDVIYVMTIWNLGTMFGVMTDKGVRTTGFYGVVRHPSYTMEALMFLALWIQGFTTAGQWLSGGMVLLIYWIRSEREDQFMGCSNPLYRDYRETTRFKFVPGLF